MVSRGTTTMHRGPDIAFVPYIGHEHVGTSHPTPQDRPRARLRSHPLRQPRTCVRTLALASGSTDPVLSSTKPARAPSRAGFLRLSLRPYIHIPPRPLRHALFAPAQPRHDVAEAGLGAVKIAVAGGEADGAGQDVL